MPIIATIRRRLATATLYQLGSPGCRNDGRSISALLRAGWKPSSNPHPIYGSLWMSRPESFRAHLRRIAREFIGRGPA